MASKLAEGRSPVDTWIILHKSLRNKTTDTETRCIVPLCFVRKLQYPELDKGKDIHAETDTFIVYGMV